MKQSFGLMGWVCVLAIQGVADNRHWQGAGGSGVGDFEVPTNWQQGSVPGAADLAAFNNRVNAHWAITFNGATTNTTGSVVAPSAAYETVFNLNQQVWSLTSNLYVWEGSGGRITYSNGTIRTGSLGCETAPPAGSSLTNHAVIAFRGVQAEVVSASFGGTRTSFEGGSLSVSNVMNVGVSTNSARYYATVYLLNGARVAVTNEVRIADGAGTTARVEVYDADFRLGGNINYLGVNARSKGTLSLGTNANVLIPGYLHAGFNGHGVIEQTEGDCIVSNSFDLGENWGGRGELNLQGGQFVILDLRPAATNYFRVAVNAGSTGEVTLAGSGFSFPGETCTMGRSGYGQMTVARGTNFFGGNLVLGSAAGGVGALTVLDGSNTFSRTGGTRLQVGGIGRGSLLGHGGTNHTCGISVANDVGSFGTMTVSNGLWTIAEHMWVGNSGNGTLTFSGGEMRFLNTGGSVLAVGRAGVATGEVTVAGGLVDMVSNGSVWVGRADQTATKISGRLVLTGNGVLRTKQVFEYAAGPGAASQILFDGGTLKASASGALVYDLDDVRLTANGMVIDSAGFSVSVVPTLQDAAGEAGGITKKGAGTLTLAGTRAATGPVSVLAGTLVASNNLAVAAGTSRVDGTLTLTAENRLTVAAGAALAGTGTVARVTLQDSAVFLRSKADGAVSALNASDCVAENRITVALTGFSFTDLKTPLPLIRASSVFVAPSNVTVTLNGQTNPFLNAKFVEVGGLQVLSVSYSSGTLISVR
jgi:autotransporter-associated beta strand protein/T5SS/PEP-CTERM-associated repeat protein